MQTTLEQFLSERGFTRISLERSGVGHFHAAGTLAGRAITMVLDTGASNTLVDVHLARELGLELTPLAITGGGVGSASVEIFSVAGASLVLGDLAPRVSALYAMDFTHVNQSLAMKGESAVDAVLGADVFENHAAVIDYGTSSLFLH